MTSSEAGDAAPAQAMVIFSLGGPLLARHLRPRSVRCQTGFVPLGGRPQVVLDPFPDKGMRGVIADGEVRIVRDGHPVATALLTGLAGPGSRRWDDLDLLAFVGRTLWTWVALPLLVADPPPGVAVREVGERRLDVTVAGGWPATSTHHVLDRDAEGAVVRHEEEGVVHALSDHCDFGGGARRVVIATKRRSRSRAWPRGPVLWADVVAAAVFPGAVQIS